MWSAYCCRSAQRVSLHDEASIRPVHTDIFKDRKREGKKRQCESLGNEKSG